MTDTVTYQDPNKPPYTPKAFYSTYLGNWGVALRTAEGRVFFRYEDLGLWTELFDHDAPDLILHGECALVDAAWRYNDLHRDLYQPRTRVAA